MAEIGKHLVVGLRLWSSQIVKLVGVLGEIVRVGKLGAAALDKIRNGADSGDWVFEPAVAGTDLHLPHYNLELAHVGLELANVSLELANVSLEFSGCMVDNVELGLSLDGGFRFRS